MKRLSGTPIRRLEGVTYWVTEDSYGIYDFINTEIRKEWEADARSEGRNPKEDMWLNTLAKRRWSLQTTKTDRIKLNSAHMNYVDSKRGYDFAESLAKRSRELQHEIETYSLVVWPVIVREEDWFLMDGYCRITSLRAMKVRKIYAYVGIFAKLS